MPEYAILPTFNNGIIYEVNWKEKEKLRVTIQKVQTEAVELQMALIQREKVIREKSEEMKLLQAQLEALQHTSPPSATHDLGVPNRGLRRTIATQ